MMNKFTQRLSILVFAIGAAAPAVYADQVVTDDYIVQGSLCVGLDCVNGENFNYDTIRLKENNTRIKFIDSSSTSSFPSIDWQLTANDSTNGGLNKFSIEDVDGTKVPFTIVAGAPNHSIYVFDNGNVGINTSTPLVEMHIKDGNSPALRLEQDGSSGFTSQAWDVSGNETNFFIRDVTNGSKIPFKIVPNAPVNSLYIAADGDIGLETSTPDGMFDVAHSTDANDHAFLIAPNSNVGVNIGNSYEPLGLFDVNTAAGKSGFLVQSDGKVGFSTGDSALNGRFDVRGNDYSTSYLNIDDSGDLGIGTNVPVGRFEVTSIGGADAYLAVNAAGKVGVGTNAPTAVLDVTAADATMLIKDTTDPGAAELRALLKLYSQYGNQIQFATVNKPGKEWHVGTSQSGTTFQITRADNNGNSNMSLGNGTLVVTKSDGTEIIRADSNSFTVNSVVLQSSSRTVKNNIVGVDGIDILDKLSSLAIKKWNYIADGEGVKHIGPIAEDFYEVFGLGPDEKHIASLDTSGIALAAIQALHTQSLQKDTQLKQLELENKRLNDRLAEIEMMLRKFSP
jgi:hypothetical protein